jgi:hypothetical protein
MLDPFSPEPDRRQSSKPEIAAKRVSKAASIPKLPQHARFPVSFYVVHHLPTNSYGSAVVGRTRGLACFTRPDYAMAFSASMETRENLIVEIYMEDAVDIASASTPRSGALILADSLETPLVFRLSGKNRRY